MAKIAFIQKNLYEHLGPMALSGYLKSKGHDANIFVEEGENHLMKAVQQYHPDIIAFSCCTGEQYWAIEMAAALKQRTDAISVFGGPHATFAPDSLIKEPNVDIICIGEGEEALLELAETISSNKCISHIPNLWVKKGKKVYKNKIRPFIQQLDSLPFPDIALYNKYPTLRKITTKRFMAGRGCPYRCAFCYNANYSQLSKKGEPYVRKKSVKRFIEEIKTAQTKVNIETVRFSDNTFTADKKWTSEFLRRYKREIGLPFSCLLRANEVDEELVKLLKESGCEHVAFGIESGSDHIRNEVFHKNLRKEDIINAAKLFKRYKIIFQTYNIFGAPTETLEEAFETLYLNIKIKADIPTTSVLQLYPGTPILEYAKKQGLVREDLDIYCNRDGLDNWRFGVMEVKSPNSTEIENLHKFFFITCKLPFILPLVKQLIKLPQNKFYDFLYKICLFYKIRYVIKPNVGLIASYIFRRTSKGFKNKVLNKSIMNNS